ncbi:MAG: polyprenyl synthetase family protein [Chloroflexota bacterium]|nr:polyprenyl synthetase family protein [Chloroflexota bacterium]
MRDLVFLEFIGSRVQQVEARMRSQSNGYNSDLGVALDHLLSSGGKRIRPLVAGLVGGMLGGELEDLVILGASIELLHTATLVHDDLIDGALLRRGNPTLNANWSSAATVLAGDYLFSRAASLGAELENPSILKFFSDTLSTIVSGEITQLFTRQHVSDREAYYERIYEKTASLFVLAAKAAAMLSPVDIEVMECAQNYGYELGMAFQIVDDILDFTGEQVAIGKPVGSDLRQGIVTLPVISYLELHPDDDRVAALVEHGGEKEEMDDLVHRIRSSEAIEIAHKEAKQFIARALDVLDNLPDGREHQALVKLAEFVVSRRV